MPKQVGFFGQRLIRFQFILKAMIIKLEIPDEFSDAICTRFGYDQIEEKDQPSKEDFIVGKLSDWIKTEAGSHISAEAAATASRQAIDSISALEVVKGV